MRKNDFLKLTASILLPLTLGALAGIHTSKAVSSVYKHSYFVTGKPQKPHFENSL